MSHGGNHYTRTVANLETALREKMDRLKLLEQENSALRLHERVLASSISTLERGLALRQQVLCGGSCAGGGCGGGISTGAISRQQQCAELPGASACSSASAGTTTAGCMLSTLGQQEGWVQQALQQAGCVVDVTESLCSVQLLRRAAAEPGRAASHLAMSHQQRIEFASLAVQRMALLLAKCGTTSTGSVEQQLEAVVDDLLEHMLTCGLLDSPNHMLDHLIVNMETMELEPYPQGWWLQVVEGIPLTKEQLEVLQISWPRVRAARDSAASQHEATMAHLAALGSAERARAEQLEAWGEHSLPRLVPHGLIEAELLDALCQAAKQAHDGPSRGPAPSPALMQQQQQQQQHAFELNWQLQQQADLLAEELLSCPAPAPGRADTMSAESSELAAAVAAAMADEVAAALAEPGGDIVPLPVEGGASSKLPEVLPAGHDLTDCRPPGSDLASGGGCLGPSPSTCSLALLAGPRHPRGGLRATIDWMPPEVPEEVLLPVLYSPASREQCRLENQLNASVCKIKQMHFCALAALCDVLTKKQAAQLFVLSFPYIPDAYSFFDALEELGALPPARRVAAH